MGKGRLTGAVARVSPVEASRLAAEAWGLQAEASPLGGWTDSNFELRSTDRRTFVLKVSPPATSRAVLEAEGALLSHLARSPLAPLIPRAVPTTAGSLLHAMTDDDGATRWVRLLTFLDGTPVAGSATRSPRLLDAIGRTIARLDLALADFDHPAIRLTHDWDLMATVELARFVGLIENPDRRALVEHHLGRFAAIAAGPCDELDRGVIHGDLNDHNLLVRRAGDDVRLAGIIDFGDALRSPVVAELAIAASYLMLDRDEPLADAGHLVRGFNSIRRLTDLERELLADLVLGRICASVLHAAAGQVRAPDNEYLQISAASMWRLLERPILRDVGALRRVVEAACR